jgi:hypothetical protein
LEPATLDLDGSSIWMFGTPNASSSGYFYDADVFERSSWSKHNWTLLDNPHLTWSTDMVRQEEGGEWVE